MHVEWFARKPIVEHDFTAHKGFKWKCRKHIEAEAKTSNVDHYIVGREVVQDVALSFSAEG